MRIIAGEFGSRRIKPVPGHEVRPTPDRLREALFNILAFRLEGCTFLDAYAGTGAVGIEAVSRGVAKAILIEKSKDALAIMEENVRSLGIQRRVQMLRGSAHLLLPRHPADIVFLDPPYANTSEYDTALTILGTMQPQLVIAQHQSKHQLNQEYGSLKRTRVLKQGDNSLSFFERLIEGSAPPEIGA